MTEAFAFIRGTSVADSQARFLSSDELDRLRAYFSEGEVRMASVNHISSNAAVIVASTCHALFAEQPQLIAPNGNAYTTRRMAACLRDMEFFLRYITYSLVSGSPYTLDDRCLNGLRETYLALGVPIGSVISAIIKMRDITLNSLTTTKEQSELRELKISEIRKSYPKQWVTIEITKFENGFPSAGRILHYDHDLDHLADKVSQLSGDNVYTFFTSTIDEKPEPLVETSTRKIVVTSENQSLLNELASYFDRCASSLE